MFNDASSIDSWIMQRRLCACRTYTVSSDVRVEYL